jgi:SAM-dependent methyltransferase
MLADLSLKARVAFTQFRNYAATRPAVLRLGRRPAAAGADIPSRASRRADLHDPRFIETWSRFLRTQAQELERVSVDPNCCDPAELPDVTRWYRSRESHRVTRWAPRRYGRSRGYSGHMIWEAVWTLMHLPVTANAVALDVGSENSFLPQYLAWQGASVTAVDRWDGSYGEQFRAHVLSKCRAGRFSVRVRRDDGSTRPVTYQQEDATRLSLPPDSFDLVTSLSVIEHITDDAAAMREMARVLKPGGLLALTTSLAPDWQQASTLEHHLTTSGRWEGDLDRVYSPDAVFSRLINPSGLQLAGAHDFGIDRARLAVYTIPGLTGAVASVAIFLTKPA